MTTAFLWLLHEPVLHQITASHTRRKIAPSRICQSQTRCCPIPRFSLT